MKYGNFFNNFGHCFSEKINNENTVNKTVVTIIIHLYFFDIFSYIAVFCQLI